VVLGCLSVLTQAISLRALRPLLMWGCHPPVLASPEVRPPGKRAPQDVTEVGALLGSC
jgi:hypothetical protein